VFFGVSYMDARERYPQMTLTDAKIRNLKPREKP